MCVINTDCKEDKFWKEVELHLAVIISTINKQKKPSHTIPKRDLGYVVIRLKRDIGLRTSLRNSPVNSVRSLLRASWGRINLWD